MGKHVTKADLEKLHQPPEGAGGKGCLTRHQRREEGHKCSHQWQAGVKARSHWKVYVVKGHPNLNPLAPDAFTHFKNPYWHNAHHIIPNGSLKTAIADAGKGTAGMTNLIKQGLLKAQYNLNDKINMVILPMQMEFGVLLRLPRHLKGDQVGPGEKSEMFSHAAYSDEAEEKLRPIMDQYKAIAADAMKDAEKEHKKPDATFSKQALETLSDTLYKAIKSAGKEEPGQALSNLTDLIFA